MMSVVLLRIKLLVVVFSCVLSVTSQETPLIFDHVTGTKGVSLGKIAGITQDKFGYMWFTDQTNRSLVRYDGYRMKIYRNIIGDTNTINTYGLEAIDADTSGNLWIGNENGVDKLDILTSKVSHYYFPSGRKSGYVLDILVDHLGIVWIATPEGLFSFDDKTHRFTQYVNRPGDSTSISCNMVYNIYEDRKGVLWLATGWPYGKHIFDISCGGLNRFNRNNRTFTHYTHDPNNPHSLVNNIVRAIFEDSRGNFWVGTQGDGLHLMNREQGTFERLTYDAAHPRKLARPPMGDDWDHIPFIIEDGAGAIWIGSYLQGLVRYNPDTKKLTHYASETRPNGFSDNSAWCAYKSRDGVLWISTEQRNLYRVDPLQNTIPLTRLDNICWSFFEDPPGTLWVGTMNNGLKKFDTKSPINSAHKNYLIAPGNHTGVNAICHADSGKYWAATFRGVFLFDPKTGVFTPTGLKDAKHNKDLTAIFISNAHTGSDVIITGIGLHMLNTKNNSLTDYWHNPYDSTSINADTLVTTVEDRNGNLWIATKDAGINYFNLKSKKFSHYLEGLTVYSIFIDNSETVWAGTIHGLFRKQKDSTLFSIYPAPSDEAANASVNGICSDDKGNIWASSSSGIFRINVARNEFALYGKRFGVTNIDWNLKSHAIHASDGRLYFGAIDGYYSFNPDKIINSTEPNILLTGFRLDGHEIEHDSNGILKQPIEQVQQIELPHNQNIFSIDFAAIHYSDPENNILQYMLEGYENTWRVAGIEKTAYYFNIPPGRYTFRIHATTSYGRNGEKRVSIIILPPWWQTWWAYCLYGVLAGFGVWFFIRWRTSVLQKKNILLEDKVAERTRELVAMQTQLIAEKEAKLTADFNQKFSESELKALRAQMNPHFVFNILNTIESYALDNNKEAASMMIQKFSRLTRMVLENSMSQLIPIKNDLRALQLYIELEQMRYAGKFVVCYNITHEIMDEDYLIPPMIIQPFVENAILHGLRNRSNGNGILTVSADVEDGYIVVAVEDNGIGREKAALLKVNNPIQKKSIGINVTHDRIAIFNNLNHMRKARVDIQDLDEGTRVVIHLPLTV